MADAYFAVTAGPAAYAGLQPDPQPRPRVARALVTVLACIGLGLLGQEIYASLTAGGVEPAEAVRYAFVTTLGTYVLVAAVLVGTVKERLRWDVTPVSLAIGAAFGGGFALVLLGGDVSATDPRLALLVSEGSFAHIAATVLVAVVAAPLTEEVLFRGLMLESLADRSRRLAVWASGFAFAAWHLTPAAMVYYTLFGAVFGALYLRRGLACSAAAHAAFNGTLVVAAVLYALGPGVTVTASGLVVTAPPGWHAAGPGLDLRGPSASQVVIQAVPDSPEVAPAEMLRRIVEGDVEGGWVTVDESTARMVRLPVGEAMRVRVSTAGRDGDLVMFPANGRTYVVALVSGGSPRVRADFDKILRDLRVRR